MPKHKYIESPERLWELFTEYKTETKANPIKVHDFVGKDAEEVYRLKERPLTMVGFECFVANQSVICNLKNYFANSDNKYEEYSTICSRIKAEIQEDQIGGGMVGIYNPSITQRLNGLTEKQEIESKVTQTTKIDLSNYTDEELRILTELQRKGGISEA